MNTGSAENRVVAGRYRLDSHLGSGGMGTVWRGWDERLRRTVAVKQVTIPQGMPEDEAVRLRERYLREARAAARLRHPAVVGVYDVVQESGQVWIVMELINARDLAAVLRSEGPLEPVRAAQIGLQLLDALDAAHEAGVLHRDVKPANVLIDSTDRTVLTDFGVASVTGDSSLTRTGQLVGSPAYLAPERLTGGTVGPASDLWSLGCTLYAAVEGRPPFHRPEQFAIIAAITVEPVPPALRAGLLGPVLYGLLDKDQATRWDSPRTRAALERVVAGEAVADQGWGAPSPGEPHDTPAPPTPVPVQALVDRPTQGADADATTAEPRSPAPTSGGTTPVELEPARPPRRRGLVVGALALALVMGVASVYFLNDRTRITTGGIVTPSPTASNTQAPTPANEEWVHPTLPFKLRKPTTWSVRLIEETQTTRFNTLTGSARTDETEINKTNNLYVYVHDAGGLDALQLAEAEDRRWSTHENFANYKQLRMGPASMGNYQGSILEFTADHAKYGPRHVLIFRTVIDDVSYEVSLNGPASTFANDLGVFDDAVDSLVITAPSAPRATPNS